MDRLGLLALVGGAALAAVVMAVALSPLLEVGIEGVVDVPPRLKAVDIKLVIDREKGTASFDLGEVAVPKGSILAKAVLVSHEGEFGASVSGVLTLESGERVYRIAMPCAIAIGEPCYRVMVLIPGYDTPLPVEEGAYRATLNLSWVARGWGRFYARLYIETVPQGGVRASVAGVKPKTTDGWVMAEGSTRSYSMLLSTNTSAEGRVSAWIWVYDPQQVLKGVGLLRVIDEETRSVVEEVELRMFRDGPYWSILVDISLEPGRGYTVEFSHVSVSLGSKILLRSWIGP